MSPWVVCCLLAFVPMPSCVVGGCEGRRCSESNIVRGCCLGREWLSRSEVGSVVEFWGKDY